MAPNQHRGQHRTSNAYRSSNGCWTCKLRRKKCDERHPACGLCTVLHITCHGYDPTKPEWMDGGVLQEEMAQRLKRAIKESNRSHGRRWDRRPERDSDEVSRPPNDQDGTRFGPDAGSVSETRLPHSSSDAVSILPPPILNEKHQTSSLSALCKLGLERSMELSRSDNVLLMFYLEHLLPFLFPFFRPSLFEGGRAWLLEMMISSPVMRRATLCQSAYFFTLFVAGRNPDWETVLAQTNEAFGILRAALGVIEREGVVGHVNGSVRTLASIMQVQRFVIALSSFEHCHTHLNAAIALFEQIMESADADEPPEDGRSRLNIIMDHLGPPTPLVQAAGFQVPSAEQIAFRFASSLLILDDVVASTILQEPPKLQRYHNELLDRTAAQSIRLEEVVGCQNWVVVHVGETSRLDAWKKQRKEAGDLDVMELVHRAASIKQGLEDGLAWLERLPVDTIQKRDTSLLEVFTADNAREPGGTCGWHSIHFTRIWAHAALIYLSIVVSGWQPTNSSIRYHVARIMELTTDQKIPLSLLRTIVWPLCVAGCLATREQEDFWRSLLEEAQPASAFGTLKKALQLMEEVWASRDLAGDSICRDLPSCFQSRDQLILLV